MISFQALAELYDLVADPDEQVNLYDAAEAEAVRQALTEHLESRPQDMRPDAVPVGTA